MKKLITILIYILLIVPVVSAHALETKQVIRSDGQYNIEFSIDPEFPLVNRETHLDFEIWDNNGETISEPILEIELIKEGDIERLTPKKSVGHYEIAYVFDKEGVYKIITYLDDQKLDIEFNMEVDSFGLSGILRSGAIILLLLILISLMYNDCIRRS